MIVALEVPLALNLQRRAVAELESNALAQTQAIASVVGERQAPSADLDRIVAEAERSAAGRVIVVDAAGVLIADSAGAGLVGRLYATAGRPELLTALREGVPGSRLGRSEALGEEILATSAPILAGGRPVGAVRITQPTTELRRGIRRTIIGIAAIGLGGLVAGLVLALAIAGSLSRPLRRLAGAATRLGGGDLSVRTGGAGGSEEIREVARAFDEMADRLERLVRAQREFAGNASHQLRTPLTGLKLRLESAVAKAPPGLRRDLEAAEVEADRLAAIVDRLLTLARRVEEGGATEADLAVAAERAAARWRERVARAGASLAVRADGGHAATDPADVDQMLDNLIDNALRYAPGPAILETGADGARAFLAVADAGPGIPEDERAHVTERFFRGRGAPAGGSGLGLAIVRELAERWGGEVAVVPGPNGGTRVEVRLPAAGA